MNNPCSIYSSTGNKQFDVVHYRNVTLHSFFNAMTFKIGKKLTFYCISSALFISLLGYILIAELVAPKSSSHGKLLVSSASPPYILLPTSRDWNFDSAPEFCKELILNPRPPPDHCDMNMTNKLCRDGKPAMFSQMQQDYYLWTRHFSKLRRRGVYLDIAANLPVEISNTYFMDACLGWSGVCVEGNPQMLPDLFRERSCAMIPACVSNKDGVTVRYALYKGLSGIISTNKNKFNRNIPVIEQKCTTMKLALKKMEVKVVDYLSLDVEGHELQVLQGIDWNKVRVKVMTVEGNEEKHNEIGKFLKDKGYVRHTPDLDDGSRRSKTLWEDAIFLHKSVKFGSPR